MSDRLLFISDLHLQAERPDITRALLQFLDDNSGRCTSLYILGDLFEAWLGDDVMDVMETQIASALRDFAARGATVHLMHGNRDFLIGEEFAGACHATLLPDPCTISTPLGEVILSHGDQLCTDDTEYQQFRKMVRQPQWQAQFLAQSPEARQAFAREARQQSQAATRQKAEDIMDVNAVAVEELLRKEQLPRLIHGHTHRPALHEMELPEAIDGQRQAWRLVLGDWDQQGWYGEIHGEDLRLEKFPLS